MVSANGPYVEPRKDRPLMPAIVRSEIRIQDAERSLGPGVVVQDGFRVEQVEEVGQKDEPLVKRVVAVNLSLMGPVERQRSFSQAGQEADISAVAKPWSPDRRVARVVGREVVQRRDPGSSMI